MMLCRYPSPDHPFIEVEFVGDDHNRVLGNLSDNLQLE
jgi:hypothetical protein